MVYCHWTWLWQIFQCNAINNRHTGINLSLLFKASYQYKLLSHSAEIIKSWSVTSAVFFCLSKSWVSHYGHKICKYDGVGSLSFRTWRLSASLMTSPHCQPPSWRSQPDRLLHSPSQVAAGLWAGCETWPTVGVLRLAGLNIRWDCFSHNGFGFYKAGGNFYCFSEAIDSPLAQTNAGR